MNIPDDPKLWQTSRHRCPRCCERLRRYDFPNGDTFLWCSFGPCMSEGANVGAYGRDEADAYIALRIACESEPLSE